MGAGRLPSPRTSAPDFRDTVNKGPCHSAPSEHVHTCGPRSRDTVLESARVTVLFLSMCHVHIRQEWPGLLLPCAKLITKAFVTVNKFILRKAAPLSLHAGI